MTHLAHLLSKDLSLIEPEELVQGVKDAELASDQAPEWSGRLLAALHRYCGKSWPEIARMTGVTQTTAFRRATPFL